MVVAAQVQGEEIEVDALLVEPEAGAEGVTEVDDVAVKIQGVDGTNAQRLS